MSSQTMPSARRVPLLVVGALATLQALMVLAFAWPAVNAGPREVPVVVSGPSAAVSQVTSAIEQAAPGAFDVTTVPDQSAAMTALRQREAYGAVLLTADGPRVLTASAAGVPVAQLLAALGQSLGERSDSPVTGQVPVEDVVPVPREDPRGAVIGSSLLPIVMTGVVAGALLSLLVGSYRHRVAGLVAFSVVGGALVAFIGHVVLDGLSGSYLAEAAVIGLTILAISATVVGVAAVIGRPGIPLVALTMMLLGNPHSGAASGPEMVPWGDLGQLLPPGAGVTALRSVAFFGGSSVGSALTVVLAWALVGLGLTGVAAARSARPGPSGTAKAGPAPQEPSAQPVPVAV